MRTLAITCVVLLALSCVTIMGNLPVRRGVPLEAIEVVSGGVTLWRIESSMPQPLIDLRYGVLPAGFTRVVPVGEVPRALVPGEKLQITYQYADGRVVIDAIASSPSGVRATNSYSTGPAR